MIVERKIIQISIKEEINTSQLRLYILNLLNCLLFVKPYLDILEKSVTFVLVTVRISGYQNQVTHLKSDM